MTSPIAHAVTLAVDDDADCARPVSGRVRADLDLHDVLTAVGEAAYEWDVRTDHVAWSANAAALLQVASRTDIDSSRKIAPFLNPESLETLYGAVMNSVTRDAGAGVPYQVQYTFHPHGRNDPGVLWIEDYGRWFSGSDGRPMRARGVVRIVTARHEHEQKLARLVRFDDLTGLMSRAALADSLADTLSALSQHGTTAAFLIAAVDNLAMINEAYGFDVADEILCAVARRLRNRLRAGGLIGRYSGNKFGLLLANCDRAQLATAAARLMAAIAASPLDTPAGPVPVTISIGGVALPHGAASVKAAMMHAQEALNEAKAGHRDRFALYEPRPGRESARRRNILIADTIVAALNDGRIHIAYQPIVATTDGAPALYEALARLRHLDGRVLEAGGFVPAAEKLGLTRLLDHRVLELAIGALTRDPALHLTVNISADTALDRGWLDLLTAGTAATAGLAERLIVEITETVAIHDIEESTRFISSLRALGCRIAIDDFGAGYTSFRNLKVLQIDMVKIDGSFIADVARQPDDQVFVRALIDLARNFGIATVAEWVTSAEDAALLKAWGVDYLQGNYIGAATREPPRPQALSFPAGG